MHENPHAGQGSVMLDIGGDVGALVVSMPASMVGAEIEIAPRGGHHLSGHDHGDHGHAHGDGHGHRLHVAVVDRSVTDGTVPSLVFAELVVGSYELFDKGDEVVRMTAQVVGGQVTFSQWPTG